MGSLDDGERMIFRMLLQRIAVRPTNSTPAQRLRPRRRSSRPHHDLTSGSAPGGRERLRSESAAGWSALEERASGSARGRSRIRRLDDGLGAVSGAQFGEQVGDVGLDGLDAEDEFAGDLRVRQAARHQAQYLLLAFGELVLVQPGRLLLLLGHVGESQRADRLGEQQRLAARDRADRRDDVVRGSALEQEARGAGPQRVVT